MSDALNLSRYLKRKSVLIERALVRTLPGEGGRRSNLEQAMRYAVMSGGKRIRPVLALAACEAVGGSEKNIIPAACALELVHSYSLVHDDLPCMDNDSERRGKPSCHVRFGEDTALLAGDALLTLAFQVLAQQPPKGTADTRRRLDAVRFLSEAIGARGMVGGQAADMEFQQKEPDLATIQFINIHKSGALIAVSTRLGAYLGGGTPRQVEALYRYGKYVGLLFQIADDMMDGQGYAKVLGKTRSQEEAKRLLNKAKSQLVLFGRRAAPLSALADFIIARDH